MKVLLLLLFSGAVLADNIQSNCDPNKFNICQLQFSKALGIDQSFNWHDPSGLAVQIQNIYIQGTTANPKEKGIVSVCSAYNAFLDCLNDSAFTASECFDPLFLIHADSTPIVAYQYSFLMNMQQYQCGAGFYPAVDNWSCMQKVYAAQNATLNGCVRSFGLNVLNDGLNACKYVQKGMDCWRTATLTCSPTLQYFACESFRQYTLPGFSACTEQCYV